MASPHTLTHSQVVLPEGASAISAKVAKDVLRSLEQSSDVKFTYLDTIGRPVVVLRTQHVTPDHATKLHVDYAFSTAGLLREPLLLIAGGSRQLIWLHVRLNTHKVMAHHTATLLHTGCTCLASVFLSRH